MQRQQQREQLDDELWSPEHDWILQFDKLLGGGGGGDKNGERRRSNAGRSVGPSVGRSDALFAANLVRRENVIPPSRGGGGGGSGFLVLSQSVRRTQRSGTEILVRRTSHRTKMEWLVRFVAAPLKKITKCGLTRNRTKLAALFGFARHLTTLGPIPPPDGQIETGLSALLWCPFLSSGRSPMIPSDHSAFLLLRVRPRPGSEECVFSS